MISNVYGPSATSLRAEFFLELRSINDFFAGPWTMVGYFNVLLSVEDKNGPTSNIADILKFREVVHDLGLVDLSILNKDFTWTNSRGVHTLERLDRALLSTNWLLAFPRSTLRALLGPRSDHTPLVLSAYSFIPVANMFQFESFWLRHPAVYDVVSTVWNSSLPSSDSVNQFSLKLQFVHSALRKWSTSLSLRLRLQANHCLMWIDLLDKAEEYRSLMSLEYNTKNFAGKMR